MSIKAATLAVEIDVDAAKAKQEMASFGNALKGLATGMAMGAGIGLFNAVVSGAQGAVAGLGDAIQAASNLGETVNKVNVVLGDSAAAVMEWSKSAATSMGMSQNSALTAASTFATFGKAAQLSGEDLTAFSTGFVGLSADLASFYNTSPEQAIQAIGAALRGESEPIRAYGVLLDDATLRQRALAMGIIETTTQALTPQQRVLAAEAEIWRQTADAQGDFGRTSEGLANQQRILAANMDTLSASIGTAFLPAMTALTSAGNDLVTAVLPSLGSLLETYVAPVMLDVAENVTVAAENLGTFMDAVDAGADPVGAFVDAFDLEPIVTETNKVIVAIENMAMQMQVAFNTVLFEMNEFIGTAVRQYNRMVWSMQDVGMGMNLEPMRHSNWVSDPDSFQPTPLGLTTIPTSGFGGVDPQLAPGGYGYAAQQAQNAQAKAAEAAAEALRGAGKAANGAAGDLASLGSGASTAVSDLQSALSKVPGLFGTSPVTQKDMDRAAAGLPVNYADDYVRQAADELINGIDYANIDAAEVARSVGLDPSVPAQIIIDELTRQWESGEYFANPENLAKINWQAVKDAALKEANAALGQQNIIAEALAQGITVESFKPLATDSVADMAQSITEATALPESKAALEAAGEAGFRVYLAGWAAEAGRTPPIPPSGGVTPPGGLPGGVPSGLGPPPGTVSGTSANGTPFTWTLPGNADGTAWWGGGPTWVGERGAEIVEPPRGSRIIPADQTGAFGSNTTVTVNATVANNYDLEKLAVRVASVIKSKRRGI